MFIAPLPPNSGLVVLINTWEVGAPVVTCAVGARDGEELGTLLGAKARATARSSAPHLERPTARAA